MYGSMFFDKRIERQTLVIPTLKVGGILICVQFRQYDTQHGNKADAAANEVRDRLCEEYARGSHVESIRHQVS